MSCVICHGEKYLAHYTMNQVPDGFDLARKLGVEWGGSDQAVVICKLCLAEYELTGGWGDVLGLLEGLREATSAMRPVREVGVLGLYQEATEEGRGRSRGRVDDHESAGPVEARSDVSRGAVQELPRGGGADLTMKCPRCRHKVVTPAFERSNLWRCAFCGANGCVDHGAHRLVLCCICFDVQLCPECADTIQRAGCAAFICRPCKEGEAEKALTKHPGIELLTESPPCTVLAPVAFDAKNFRWTVTKKGRAVSTSSAQAFDVEPGDVLEWTGKTWRKL